MNPKLAVAAVEMATLAAVLYLLERQDVPVEAVVWRLVMHGSQTVARNAGQLAIRAELAYRQAVQV